MRQGVKTAMGGHAFKLNLQIENVFAGSQLSLISFVEKPNWKSLLQELVYTHKLDPWDLDLDKLSRAFLERVKEMENLDLYVPGNVILALSILLRFKAERLGVEEEEDPYIESLPLQAEKPLLLPLPKKRPVTLEELTEAIERVMQKYQKPKNRAVQRSEEKVLSALPEEERGINAEEEMKSLKALLLEFMDEYGLVNLTSLLRKLPEDRMKVRFLLYSASMEMRGEVELIQEAPFSDILARVAK